MFRKNCENDDEENSNRRNCPLQIIESPSGKIIDFYLYEDIYSVGQYIDFLRAVELAKNEDLIKIHINCGGGDVDTAWNIFDALKQSQANVSISVEGCCASAASMIMLAGNEWKVNPHSFVMIHAYSGYSYGKRNELIAQSDFERRYIDKKFREMYKDFLTPEEIELCLEGRDYYFDADETLERLQRFQEDRLKKQAAIQQVAEKYQDIMNAEIQAIIEGKNQEPADSKKKAVKKS